MSNATLIDMSKLPAPAVIESLDFEAIFEAMKADFLEAYPSAADVLALESEPLTKWLQRMAYQVLLMRSRVNESALAVMLAYAGGSDLDQLAAFYGVSRLVITPADPEAIPPVPAVLETDTDLRARVQLAPQGFTVAGPVGAYVFHAKSASGDVLDASAVSPTPGTVVVSVLARDGNGEADSELLGIVSNHLNAESIRPITDEVVVQSATIVDYTIEAEVFTFAGPDSSSVLETIQQRVEQYVADSHRLGRSIALSAIYAAIHIEGVHHVELTQPAADIDIDADEAPYCTSIEVAFGGSVG